MESRAHAIVAGLFTVVLGIGVVLAALWFSRESYDHVTYVLESKYAVTGLNVQAPVKLRGVQIGKVNSIDFDSEDANAILVTIAVKAGSRITRGTTAQLGAQGITGTSYVNLEDEGKTPEFLPPGTDKASRIAVKRSLFDEFAMSGQEILFEINKMAKLAQALLSEPNQKQLVNMLNSVQSASERMNQLAQALEPGAKSLPALAGDARKLLAGAGDSVRGVAPVLQDARTALASIDKLAREYAQRADALDRVGKNADEVGSASQSVTGAAGTMAGDVVPRMNALLEELVRNSRNLDRLLADLNEQPQGLVFGRPARKPGPGESGYAEAQKK
jgi:phospholipid/cholesterol/gamma-HCH transport system substrate-binding protein